MPSADQDQRASSPLAAQHDAPQSDHAAPQHEAQSDDPQALSAQTLQDRQAQTAPQVGLPFAEMPANTRGGFTHRAIQATGQATTPEQVLTGAAFQRVITRAEAATVLSRVLGFGPALQGQPAVFNDVPVSHWAAAAIYRCREEGIFSGAGQNQFQPDAALQPDHADLVLQRAADPGARLQFDRAAALQEAQAARPQQPAQQPAPADGSPDPNHKRTFTDALYKKHDAQVEKADLKLDGHAWSVKRFTEIWEKHQARYEAVASKTNIPAKLIAALHFRESSGNFNTYLHQGDPLGKPAVNWPRNIPVFHVWEEAAVHALNMKAKIRDDLGLTASSTDMAAIAAFSEYYNGLGYHNKGKASPYVYSGTDEYSKGKYVRDGVYDANVKDQQLGVLAMVKLLENKQGTKPSQQPLGAPLDGQALLDGQPLPNATVTIRAANGQTIRPAPTSADGMFSAPGGLAAGTYQVQILSQSQTITVADEAPTWLTFNLNPAQIPQAQPATPEASPAAEASQNPLNGKVLRKGAKGALVTWVQERLNAHGQTTGVDGDFGPNTHKAVVAFQRANGLEADGVVGPLSASALAKAPANQQAQQPAQPAAQQPAAQQPQQQPAQPAQQPAQQAQQPAQEAQQPAQQTQQPAQPAQPAQQPAFTASPDGLIQVHGLSIGPLKGVFQGRARAAIIGERLAAQPASALAAASLNVLGTLHTITVGGTFFQVTAEDIAAHSAAFPEMTNRARATAARLLQQMGATLPPESQASLSETRGAAAAKSARIEYKAGVREHGASGSWETQGANKGPRVNKFKAANHAGGNNSYEWCGMFVGYHFKQAGIRTEILKNLVFWSGLRLHKFFSNGGYVATSQAKAGPWWQPHQSLAIGATTGANRKAKLDGFGPKPGDIALFRADYSHVAIVTDYDPKTGKLELIEGNRGNRVQATVYDTARGDVTFIGRFNDSDFEPAGAIDPTLEQADDPDVAHTNVSGGTR